MQAIKWTILFILITYVQVDYFHNVAKMLKLFERIYTRINMRGLVKGEFIQAEMEPMNSVDNDGVEYCLN